MGARSEHRQRVRGPAVCVDRRGGIRAGVQEQGRDLGGVGGNNLATDLDPVCGRVVQERGAVAIGRSAADQIRRIRQEAIELFPARTAATAGAIYTAVSLINEVCQARDRRGAIRY